MRLVCAILWLATGLCGAGHEPSAELVFNDLAGVPHRPMDPADKVASVLIFYWHDCPISNSYAPELNRLCTSHTNCAFYIVQVDPELTPAAAKEHARNYDLHAPVLLDPQHRLVKLAKATVTPEAVVLGGNGRILYRGRIDNVYAAPGKKRTAATEHDLLAALDAVASGMPVKVTKTTPVGCLIQ